MLWWNIVVLEVLRLWRDASMRTRVLLIQDDLSIAGFPCRGLWEGGYGVLGRSYDLRFQ